MEKENKEIKKSNKNKIFLMGILNLIIIILIVSFIFYLDYNKKNKLNDLEISNQYNEILVLDLERNYPKNQMEVININCKITKLIYSNKLNEVELKNIIYIQRQLFSEELLKSNNFNNQIYVTLKELENLKEENLIINYTLGNIVYSEDTEKISFINVTTNFKNEVSKKTKYYLIEENELYKILAWEYYES